MLINPVDEDRHNRLVARADAAQANSADGGLRRIDRLGEIEARRDQRQILGALDVVLFQRLVVERGNGNRHVLEPFATALGGHDDGAGIGGVVACCGSGTRFLGSCS
jgi:hypothetical protein